MSEEAILKEEIDQNKKMALHIKDPFKEIGNELEVYGGCVETVSQTMKDVNDVLRDIAAVMNEIRTVMRQADASLHSAGNEINKIKVPTKINVNSLKKFPWVNIRVEEEPVFGPTGVALATTGDNLHEIGESLNKLEKSIEKLSKPEGSLDKLSSDVLHPLADNLANLGKYLKKL